MAASIDEISGGRFTLGLGAGWNEPEFRAFGYPFERTVSRFEESFEVLSRHIDCIRDATGSHRHTAIGSDLDGFIKPTLPGLEDMRDMTWLDALKAHAQHLLDSNVPALLIGDFNIIPTDEDVYKPERWLKDALFAPEAREKYGELVAQGLEAAGQTMESPVSVNVKERSLRATLKNMFKK